MHVYSILVQMLLHAWDIHKEIIVMINNIIIVIILDDSYTSSYVWLDHHFGEFMNIYTLTVKQAQ